MSAWSHSSLWGVARDHDSQASSGGQGSIGAGIPGCRKGKGFKDALCSASHCGPNPELLGSYPLVVATQ